METLLKIRCKNCNVELVSHFTQTKCCGCDNMTTISNQKISAIDLSLVQIVSHIKTNKKNSYLTDEDIQWQQARKNRKVKKLEFDIR